MIIICLFFYIYIHIYIYIHTYTCKHTHVSYIYIYIYTYIHTYIHICWFNFDALAQGNAYKPTKEPINYRGPGGDRTHDLQTEATPPAASCPACTLHATEIAPKNATPMTCPWLHWTTDNLSGMHMVSISTPVCVNFELRPGAGDIHICWFNFDALAQGPKPDHHCAPSPDGASSVMRGQRHAIYHMHVHSFCLIVVTVRVTDGFIFFEVASLVLGNFSLVVNPEQYG